MQSNKNMVIWGYMEKIHLFYKLDEGAKCPVKLNDPTDAGYDVYAASDPEIVGEVVELIGLGDTYYSSIDYIQYRTGLYVEPVDKDKVIRLDLRPRSSISKYWLSLCNTPATIDHTYGNEILVRFRPVWQPENMSIISRQKNPEAHVLFSILNTLNYDKIYKKGDRICQILPEYVKEIKWIEVDKIEHNRGGFGSTGK